MSKISQRISNRVCPEGMSVEEWQIALRREQAIESEFSVEHLDDNRIWGDYLVHSAQGGRYKVAFRGVCSERNYCSCLDFRTNGLGTCKHLEAVSLKLQREVEGYPWSGRSYNAPYSSVFVSYKGGRSIRMRVGTEQSERYQQLYNRFFNERGILPPEHYQDLAELDELGSSISPHFRLYDDVYDFAQEQLQQMQWQQRMSTTHPTERVPWFGGELSEDKATLESALYKLCYHGNGLVIAPKHPLYIQLALRLLIEVYKSATQLQASYIIVEGEEDKRQWSYYLSHYPNLKSLPINLMTEQQFIERINSTHPSVCFVWVDNARGLRDWKNELSLSLKKLSIAHLYMRLETMCDLSPIQLSSTLQHISPYLLGPLYRFVHSYRQDFPLLDDGSNAPRELEHCVFFYRDIATDCPSEALPHTTATPSDILHSLRSEDKVKHLLATLSAVLDDEDALNLFKQHLYDSLGG